MVGAPFLAGQAAMRVGAGLVTIASSKQVIAKLEKRVVEIMTLAVTTDSAQSAAAIEDYIKARKVSVLVLGPGLRPSAASLVSALLKTVALPTIVDGSGLAIAASAKDVLRNHASSELILTPHLGELQRFFKQPLPKNQATLLKLAKTFAADNRMTLVVKGHPTHTVTMDGNVKQNNTGGPALATAGSGDVLAGMIGGIIAQGIEPEEAAAAAVYLHGKAGDLAANELSEPGVIASDVIDFIPKALKEIELTIG
jgi:NAD(P)H-hydrate epimerase